MADSAQTTLTHAVAQTDAIGQSLRAMTQIHERMTDSAQSAEQASRETARVADAIAEIARTTKILSINAAIEAARAGDAGRGFAVVADEVGKLSQRTARSVDETHALLKTSTDSIGQLLELVRGIDTQIQSLADKQHSLETSLEQLQYQAQHGELGREQAHTSNQPLTFDAATMGTGDDTVDCQHRKLIDMINDLDAACAEGRGREAIDQSLDFLASYVVDHFSHEEGVWEKRGCPRAAENIAAHKQLLEQFTAWKQQYEASGASIQLVGELVEFLCNWLVGHICHTDTSLREDGSARGCGAQVELTNSMRQSA